MIIQDIAPCQGIPLLAQTPQEVYTFCNSNKYNPEVTNLLPPFDPPSLNRAVNDFTVKVYPNPFFRNLKVKYRLEKEDKVTLTLRNSLGQIVKEKNFTQMAGNQLEMIGGLDLPNGMYYVTIKTTDSIKTIKVSKQSK